MSEYEFSVIKYVINSARFEPVNIGVALLDKKNKILYRRFITNFDELFRRIGVKHLNGFEKSFENYESVEKNVEIDALDKWHNSFPDSISCSKPRPISIKNIDGDFVKLFDINISVKDRSKTTRKIVINVSDGHAPFHISKTGRDFLRARLGDKRPDRGEYTEMFEFSGRTNGRTRHDQVLVEMVETLGEKSYDDKENYRCRLEIIEIPDDVEYMVVRDRWDGNREHVEELHKRWDFNDR